MSTWVIRDEQLAIFEAAGHERFARSLEEHLATHHSLDHRRLGDEGTRRLVERVLIRAPRYGIEFLDDHCRLLSLSTVFGEEFDQRPWVRRILADATVGTRAERLRRVYELARATDGAEG